MSIKLELDADSIKQAITTHISNQGFDLAGKTVEVALVNGRGGNGNRATVVISDEVIIHIMKDKDVTEIDSYIKTPVGVEVDEDVKEIANAVTEAPVELEVPSLKELPIAMDDELDPILAAAESTSDVFAAVDADMESIFPKVNPADVKAPASLF